MEVKSSEQLYLSGSASDYYTGANWLSSMDQQRDLKKTEIGSYQISAYTDSLLESQGYYMRLYDMNRDSVTITIKSLKTRSIFTPPFSRSLKTDSDMPLSISASGSVAAVENWRAGDSYTQEYISWDYSSAHIENILRGSSIHDPESGISEEERIRYLQLPTELPERVRELALSIASGCESDYDKLKALERYLASYPYTLNPGNVPPGADFVDYFLFAEQRGYCVYYASALAVMARCAGIPARYVEGYITPSENENGVYMIKEGQAHAWAEAFFPGFGWVAFEATAPYYDASRGAYAPVIERVPPSGFYPALFPDAPEASDESLPEASPAPDIPEFPVGAPDIDMKMLCAGLVAFFLAIIAVFTVLNASRGRKLGSMQNREASAAYFNLALCAAGSCGYPISPGETVSAYAERVSVILGAECGASIKAAAEIFSKARYSKNEITDDEKKIVVECYFQMLARLRKAPIGGIRYFVGRYILMRL